MTIKYSWVCSTDQGDLSGTATFPELPGFELRLATQLQAHAISHAINSAYKKGRYEGAVEAAARVNVLIDTLTPCHNRYEYVRTLNPRQFTELYQKTISGQGRFDDLVDAGIKERMGPQ